MKKVKMAVIGVGGMGKHHARNLYEINDAELIAICDIDKRKAKETGEKYNARIYSDLRKLLEKEELDGVSVVVPTNLHYRVAKQVINSSRHVFVEKPITQNTTQAKKLINLAKKRGVFLAVGHVERFNPVVQELKKQIDRGEIGRIVSLMSRRVGLYPPSTPSSDVVLDLAIHDIDIFYFLLQQRPENIWALGGRALDGKREDYAEILLSYPKSIHGVIQVNWITPIKIRQLSVTGTKGYIEVDYVNQRMKIYRSKISKDFESFGEFIIKFGRPDSIEINIAPEEPLKRELQSFVNSIKRNQKPLVNGEIGLQALITAQKAVRILKKNEK